MGGKVQDPLADDRLTGRRGAQNMPPVGRAKTNIGAPTAGAVTPTYQACACIDRATSLGLQGPVYTNDLRMGAVA